MGFEVTIEGKESLFYGQEVITNVQASLLSPGNSRARSTHNYMTMIISGKLHGEDGLNSETVKLFEWAQVPAEEEAAYANVKVDIIGKKERKFRTITFNKAFVVEYSERYGSSSGVGDFSLTIRQKADTIGDVTVTSEPAGKLAAAAPGGGGLGKIGEAVALGVAQSMLNKADPTGRAAGVMQNLSGE